MLAEYLVSLGATNLQKSKAKGIKVVNSPQASWERIFHVHLLVENFCIVFQKYILRQGFGLSLALNLFLIFHQISGSCSYEIVLIKRKSVNARYH